MYKWINQANYYSDTTKQLTSPEVHKHVIKWDKMFGTSWHNMSRNVTYKPYNDSCVVKWGSHICWNKNCKSKGSVLGINFLSSRRVFFVVESSVIVCRHRRLEAFTTDAKIIRLISRRVSVFPTAIATQLFWKKFLGDTLGSPIHWAPRKRYGFPFDKILHMSLHWLSSLSLK